MKTARATAGWSAQAGRGQQSRHSGSTSANSAGRCGGFTQLPCSSIGRGGFSQKEPARAQVGAEMRVGAAVGARRGRGVRRPAARQLPGSSSVRWHEAAACLAAAHSQPRTTVAPCARTRQRRAGGTHQQLAWRGQVGQAEALVARLANAVEHGVGDREVLAPGVIRLGDHAAARMGGWAGQGQGGWGVRDGGEADQCPAWRSGSR